MHQQMKFESSKIIFMKNISISLFVLVLFASLVIIIPGSCKKEKEQPSPQVFSATGDIAGAVAEFRATLGNLNTTPGAMAGRREIDWDGVPDNLVGKALPDNFFNPTEEGAPVARQRGLVYASNVGEFQVSNTNFTN